MPKLRKIVARKKIAAKPKPMHEVHKVNSQVLDDKNPLDQPRLIRAMIEFIGALCRDILDYPPELFTDASGPLNLNKVYDDIGALKIERDTWRARCESIEAAFNTACEKAEFNPAATPEKTKAKEITQ